MKMTWVDAEDIGIELYDANPDTDPLTMRFTDLHKMVVALPGFADDPLASNEAKLEASVKHLGRLEKRGFKGR